MEEHKARLCGGFTLIQKEGGVCAATKRLELGSS